jgi:uncharacterized coiled-coil protein SlyX
MRIRRSNHPLVRLLALTALALALLLAAIPATAQTANDLENLEDREAELEAAIAVSEDTVDELGELIEEGQLEVRMIDVELELITDEIARVTTQRNGPDRVQIGLAIDQYMRGDPVAQSLYLDLTSVSPSIDGAATRTVYEALAESASAEVEEFNAELADLDSQRIELEERSQELEMALPEYHAERETAGTELIEMSNELASIQDTLDWLRELSNRSRLTGQPPLGDNERPVLAVKIDNVDRARPQAGINDADVVIEEMVEGNLTRLVALFHSRDPVLIGPVRSARTSDVLILSNQNRPLFANSGGNPSVMGAVRDSSLVDVGILADPRSYSREGTRPAPHNLFTTSDELRSSDAAAGAGTPPHMFVYHQPGVGVPDGGNPSAGVTINFGNALIDYTWGAEVQGWSRLQNGSPHIDDKAVVATPTNVIVQFTDYRPSSADARSPEAIVEGSGDAWVFTGGRLIVGRWQRDGLEAVTTYTDGDGNPIKLTVGTTWIELAPPGTATLK